MSADLLDRLIGDILATTETLMAADTVEIESLAAPTSARVEKQAQSMGRSYHKKGNPDGPHRDGKGILKTIC